MRSSPEFESVPEGGFDGSGGDPHANCPCSPFRRSGSAELADELGARPGGSDGFSAAAIDNELMNP